jgi:hypothetical protein
MKHIQALLNRMLRALTRPFFWFSFQIKLLFELGFKRRIKDTIKRFIYLLFRVVNRHPSLRTPAIFFTQKLGLRLFFQRLQSEHLSKAQSPSKKITQLTPRAYCIYTDLKDAIEKYQQKVN